MRSHDEHVLRTALPDIGSDLAALLADVCAGKTEPTSATALDHSLERVRRGHFESEFTSAAPEMPGSASG